MDHRTFGLSNGSHQAGPHPYGSIQIASTANQCLLALSSPLIVQANVPSLQYCKNILGDDVDLHYEPLFYQHLLFSAWTESLATQRFPLTYRTTIFKCSSLHCQALFYDHHDLYMRHAALCKHFKDGMYICPNHEGEAEYAWPLNRSSESPQSKQSSWIQLTPEPSHAHDLLRSRELPYRSEFMEASPSFHLHRCPSMTRTPCRPSRLWNLSRRAMSYHRVLELDLHGISRPRPTFPCWTTVIILLKSQTLSLASFSMTSSQGTTQRRRKPWR